MQFKSLVRKYKTKPTLNGLTILEKLLSTWGGKNPFHFDLKSETSVLLWHCYLLKWMSFYSCNPHHSVMMLCKREQSSRLSLYFTAFVLFFCSFFVYCSAFSASLPFLSPRCISPYHRLSLPSPLSAFFSHLHWHYISWQFLKMQTFNKIQLFR